MTIDTKRETTAPRSQLVGVELLPGDEAEAVVTAALEAQDTVVIDRNAAVVIVSAPGRLVIPPDGVREALGRRDWEAEHIQVIMASYFGFITQLDEDGIVLEWLSRTESGRIESAGEGG